MMVWRFLKHYGMGKAGEVLDEFASAVVAFDPDNAGKAQIAMMQAELNKLAKRLAEAEAELRREHRETEELHQGYQRYFEAARVLEQKLAQTESDTERHELEASLAKLVDQLERLKPELAREQEEDREAEIWARELRASFEGLAAKLRTAESDLRSAKRRMETAKLQQQRVVERDRKSSAAAGLTSAVSAISVALDSMNKETARVRAENEALELKARVLQGDRIEHDPHIAAALGAASPKPVADASSLRDRLARLEDRPALPSASAA
jgi:chromosome segregation ATPase